MMNQTSRLRCEECGELRYPQRVHGGDLVAPSCEKHPDAPFVNWTVNKQAAAIWIEQRLLTASWSEIERDIQALPEGHSKAKVLGEVFPLVSKWQGLPERSIPSHAISPPTGGDERPHPLFGKPATKAQEQTDE